MRALLVAAFSLPLAAQVADVAAPPPSPLLHIETVGPAGWRSRFAPTNLGSLLESAAGRKVWQPALVPFETVWQTLVGGSDVEFAAARRRLLDYRGRVQLLVWAEPPAAGEHDLTVTAGCVLEGDGTTDLAALASDLHTLLARLPSDGGFTSLDIDGRQLQVLRKGNEQLTAPHREGERLLAVYSAGGSLQTALRRVRSLPGGEPLSPMSPALHARVDLARAVPLARAGWRADEARGMQALGLDSLDTFGLVLHTAGPQVMVELSLSFGDAARGVFGGLFPERAVLPRLLALVPEEQRLWKAGQLDLVATLRTAIAVAAAWSGQEVGEMRAAMKQELGVDLVDELFVHTDGEALLLGPPEGVAGPGAPAPFIFTMFDDQEGDAESGPQVGFALGLKNEAAFRAAFVTMFDQQPGVITRSDSATHDGVEIWQCNVSHSGRLRVAVGRGVFVCARGPNASARIAALLDAAKAAAADPQSAPTLPADFALLRRSAPPGLNGAAILGLPAALEHGFVFEVLSELLGDPLDGMIAWPADNDGDGVADLRQLMPLLRQHGLDTVRTLTGHADGRWAWRMFW